MHASLCLYLFVHYALLFSFITLCSVSYHSSDCYETLKVMHFLPVKILRMVYSHPNVKLQSTGIKSFSVNLMELLYLTSHQL